ncbi:AAA family ATPase [Wohlfahrtiimonas larvae]|uniref:ATPase n=1 Tax=Wohlfahrtiimonas larvae TaxID=1157986 RepID=A0ABP9MV96_9GAMM|nr:AAA family ATPase [Wohlfahrtiimonas larvae]
MIELLKTHMDEHNLTQRQVADQLEVSPAQVNQYLKGAYAGDVPKLEIKIKQLIERKREKILDKSNFSYVETPKSKKAMDMIRYAHVEDDIVLITGGAGLGKTQTLKEYARRNVDVILIETEPSYTPKVLLKELCQKLGVDDRGSLHTMTEVIVTKLKVSKRLIMIDEAELLPYKALETLRRIHDKAEVGLVLAGLPRLLMNLKGKRSQHVQLYSRVGFHYTLGDKLDEQDIYALATSTLGTEEFNETLFKACGANARRLNKLLRGAIRLSKINKCKINEEMIQQFATMLIH